MTRLSVTEARQHFSKTVRRVSVAKERILLEDHGEDVAAVIPVDDLKLLERLIEEEEDRLDVEAAREALKEPGSIPYEEVRKKLGLD
ncbi:MAG: type II toxin-antitoxin system Phd/YefM family antitoxin [Acidobacteria bacterium]|nr:type II toxin-antitoxin system Phd/YefM family antitoxin [Acidobacteriota bacterium]